MLYVCFQAEPVAATGRPRASCCQIRTRPACWVGHMCGCGACQRRLVPTPVCRLFLALFRVLLHSVRQHTQLVLCCVLADCHCGLACTAHLHCRHLSGPGYPGCPVVCWCDGVRVCVEAAAAFWHAVAAAGCFGWTACNGVPPLEAAAAFWHAVAAAAVARLGWVACGGVAPLEVEHTSTAAGLMSTKCSAGGLLGCTGVSKGAWCRAAACSSLWHM